MEKTITKQSLITRLHAKKVITTSDAIKITQQMARHITVSDLMLHCVKCYDVQYKDMPEYFQEDMVFLFQAIEAQPEMFEEIKAENPAVFKKLSRKLTLAEKKQIKDAVKAKQEKQV